MSRHAGEDRGPVRCVNDAELFVLARVLKTEPGALFPRDVAVIVSALVR